MHPVDRHELLRERVRDAVVVRLRAGDAAQHLARREPAEPGEDAVPVRPHRVARRRMRDDRGRPLDGVDLGHQRRVDQARLVEELVVRPRRVLAAQPVADRVVLEREQRVQDREAEPPVAGHPGQVDPLLQVARQLAVGVEAQLAVLVRAQRAGERGVAAVDLRAVPPVRIGGHVRRRRAVLHVARVAARARDPHRPLGPRVVVGQLDLPRVLRLALAVAEPVVHLELEPRGREHVQRRRRLELVAGQQLAADDARIRLQQRRQRIRVRAVERHVAAEAGADAAHRRIVEVVPAAVERACRPRAVAARAGRRGRTLCRCRRGSRGGGGCGVRRA